MFCRMCGKELSPDANYCPGCGSPVALARPQDPRSPSRKGFRVAVVLAVCLVLLVAVSAVVFDDEEERSKTQGDLTIWGGLVCSDVTFEDDGLLYIGGGSAVWSYLDTSSPYLERTSSGYVPRSHTEVGGMLLTFDSPGTYDVVLYVDGEEHCHGTAVLDGRLTRTYEWKATMGGQERTFSVDFAYTLSEYTEYSDDDAVRHSSVFGGDSRFVVTDRPIQRLSSSLEDSYRSVFGDDASVANQDYADYLLSFVQCAITYPDTVSCSDGGYVADPDGSGDLYLYGTTEYWAYPMETLHLGSGDCEDTSFLLCSLLSVAGYDSALVSMPSHMMVAVELESFSLRDLPSNLVLACKKIPDHEYNLYFCETTYARAVPAGYVTPGLHDEIADEVGEVLFVPRAA